MTVGDLWWDSDEGDLLVYYNDGNSSQWVDIGNGVRGAQGATGAATASSSAPTSATSTGTAGTIAYDSNYVYICVATNTWRRVAISSW